MLKVIFLPLCLILVFSSCKKEGCTAVINSILVFNLEGRLLYESQSATSSVTIDLSDLDHGIYLLKIKTLIDETEVRLTERIIVSK